MILKEYQSDALDCLEDYFKQCKISGNPEISFLDVIRRQGQISRFYHPVAEMPRVPYVCLRIPTGGGKTLVGGMAIERANRSLMCCQNSVTLWLVPSEAILTQTLKALRTPDSFLRRMVLSSLTQVEVLDIAEALRVKPAVLNGSNVIIVSTMQAFKREDTNTLNVYKQNTDALPHFENISDVAMRGDQSTVDVLRLRHPFIIVDEAHNQRKPLAFKTLARFEPSAILELTATPDRTAQPSNVLFSVGASALETAQMIKMPINLVRRDDWQNALRDAVTCLNNLQNNAEESMRNGGNYLRPVMLIQAQRHDNTRDPLTPEVIQKELLNSNVSADEIAIATEKLDSLTGENILSEKSCVRFIITIDKLREGWDCPFAYVLCTFRNTTSQTAAEQILGRILRMPYAKRNTIKELNEAYAFVTSLNFQETVENLKEGLVRNGFERERVDDIIRATDEETRMDLFSIPQSVTVEIRGMPDLFGIPESLQEKVEFVPESGTLTLKSGITPAQFKKLESLFNTMEDKNALHEGVQRLQSPKVKAEPFPSEKGQRFRIPTLSIRQGELWEPFGDTHLLQGDWHILDYSPVLSETEFAQSSSRVQGGQFSIQNDDVQFNYFDIIETQLAFLNFRTNWSKTELVGWLGDFIPDDHLLPDEKAAFLNKAVSELVERRGFKLDDLVYSKSRLRGALEQKIKNAKRMALASVHRSLLSNPEQFQTNEHHPVIFERGRYEFDWVYRGFTHLPKHFFPQIGNLKEKGEEFNCACFLATELEDVDYWVRNVDRKPSSFSLQTATDRFYPDFICKLRDGRILSVEYKNERDYLLPENEEKRELGDLWERRSNGTCLFVLPKGEDWEAIKNKVKGKSG